MFTIFGPVPILSKGCIVLSEKELQNRDKNDRDPAGF